MMIVISVVRPAARQAAGQESRDETSLKIDMQPWRHAGIASAIIVVLTLAFYIALAQ
jgi:uncharacterized sodium:solute symporter family permease YidK